MKKPWWVSMCGWGVIGAWAWFLGQFLLYRWFDVGPGHDGITGLILLASMPMLAFWILGTLVYKTRQFARRAAERAARERVDRDLGRVKGEVQRGDTA